MHGVWVYRSIAPVLGDVGARLQTYFWFGQDGPMQKEGAGLRVASFLEVS